jgi:hypothetical protein
MTKVIIINGDEQDLLKKLLNLLDFRVEAETESNDEDDDDDDDDFEDDFCPCYKKKRECDEPERKDYHYPGYKPVGEPRPDDTKIFGVAARIDEPRREDYSTRWEFERDHAKYDAVVDAIENCTWKNKSDDAPLHRVNAIRRPVEAGPPLNINLVGETHWWN